MVCRLLGLVKHELELLEIVPKMMEKSSRFVVLPPIMMASVSGSHSFFYCDQTHGNPIDQLELCIGHHKVGVVALWNHRRCNEGEVVLSNNPIGWMLMFIFSIKLYSCYSIV